MPVIARGAMARVSLRESGDVEARPVRMLCRDSMVERCGMRLRRARASEDNWGAAASWSSGITGIAGEALRLQSLCALVAWCLLLELCKVMGEVLMGIRVA